MKEKEGKGRKEPDVVKELARADELLTERKKEGIHAREQQQRSRYVT